MWSFVPLVAVALGGLALRIVAARARTRARRPARAATATTAATGDSGSSADTAPAAH
jgi:hypothetical protein